MNVEPRRGLLLHSYRSQAGISLGNTRKYIRINVCIRACYGEKGDVLQIAFC